MDRHQREYILREELKVIRQELGEDSGISDAEEFEEAAAKLEAPEEVKEKLKREISRFKNTIGSQAENGVIRTYIETLLEMPWEKRSEENNDIQYARKVLDEDHYGMETVKERILESLAVRTLTRREESPILCLVGPPGTGKTSIARSLARATNRPYVRISWEESGMKRRSVGIERRMWVQCREGLQTESAVRESKIRYFFWMKLTK